MNFIEACKQKERISKLMASDESNGIYDQNFISSGIKPMIDRKPIVIYNVKNAAEFKTKYNIVETDYVSVIDNNYDEFTKALIEGRLILREE